MKEKMIESIQATRKHFKGKNCTKLSYFQHLAKELKVRELDVAADTLQEVIMQRLEGTGAI